MRGGQNETITMGSIGSGAMPPNGTRSHVFGVDDVIIEIETGA